MSHEELALALRALEEDLQLGSGTLIKLWADRDPWSFVIKAHALLETGLSEMLTSILFNPKLKPVVDYLPMGGRFGKISFLRAADLLTPPEQTFLDELQQLRNDLVHSFHNVRFDFATFFVSHPKQARRMGAAAAAFGGTSEIKQRYEDHFESDPQMRIWLAVLYVLARSRSFLLKTDAKRRGVEATVKKLLDSA